MVTGKDHRQHVLIALGSLPFHSACHELRIISETVRSDIRIVLTVRLSVSV